MVERGDIVISTNTRSIRLNELHQLINGRLIKNSAYFSSNQLLVSTYDFFKKLDTIPVKVNSKG